LTPTEPSVDKFTIFDFVEQRIEQHGLVYAEDYCTDADIHEIIEKEERNSNSHGDEMYQDSQGETVPEQNSGHRGFRFAGEGNKFTDSSDESNKDGNEKDGDTPAAESGAAANTFQLTDHQEK